MAGGDFADKMACIVCERAGRIVLAERVYEGSEDDHYACLEGHRFGIDWRRGRPTRPLWPVGSELQ